MTISLSMALDALLHAESPSRQSAALDSILTELHNYNREDWSKKTLEIITVLSNYCTHHVALAKQEGAPFLVLPPEVANLSYISQELSFAASEPNSIEGCIERTRGLLGQCNPALAAASTQTSSEVLRYMETQYKLFSSSDTYCVMACPFVDIQCIAECAAPDYNIMYLNATSGTDLLEIMSFEFASATLASDDPPQEAVQLLMRTSCPKYSTMTHEDQYARLMDGLDAGLAYESPYEHLFDLPKAWAKEWHDYIVDMLDKQSLGKTSSRVAESMR